MKLRKIREEFKVFFEKLGYHCPFKNFLGAGIFPPANKKDLLFVNAGIVPMRPLMNLGGDPEKAFSIQKCVRISGKHCDIEEIGSSTRHHTCFEMAGHFIWGKNSNIYLGLEHAVNFLESLGIPRQKLSISYHPNHLDIQGVLSLDFYKDILKFEDKENLWSSGEKGDFGYCVEIYLEREKNQRIELWNCVFVTHTTTSEGLKKKLKDPYLDAGMGIGRLLSVVENRWDTYLNEDIAPIIEIFKDLGDEKARIISDYLRTSAMLISEGVSPGANSRNYVLRKLIRKSIYILKDSSKVLSAKHLKVIKETLEREWSIIWRTEIEKFFLEEYSRFNDNWDRWKNIIDKKEVLNENEVARLYGEQGIPIEMLASKVDSNFDWELCWKKLKS